MIALASEFANHSLPIYNTIAADIFHKFCFDCFCMVNYAVEYRGEIAKIAQLFSKTYLETESSLVFFFAWY